MGRRRATEPVGRRPLGGRVAERGRRRRHGAWRAPGRQPRHHVHREPGTPPDGPQHVQDRRGTDARGLPCLGACGRHACTIDFRRPQRRDGCPRHRLRAPRLVLGTGGAGSRPRRSRRDPRGARAFPPLLRRLSHFARAPEDRDGGRRSRPRDDRRAYRGGRARARALAGPPGLARVSAEPRRLLPEPRGGEPLLSCDSGDRTGGDGPLRRADGARAFALRVSRFARRRVRDCDHGVGHRDRRCHGGRTRRPGEGRRADGEALSPLQRRPFSRRAAADRPYNRGPRSHQGAGCDRGAPLPGRRDRAA